MAIAISTFAKLCITSITVFFITAFFAWLGPVGAASHLFWPTFGAIIPWTAGIAASGWAIVGCCYLIEKADSIQYHFNRRRAARIQAAKDAEAAAEQLLRSEGLL